jgi:hypothetical protein
VGCALLLLLGGGSTGGGCRPAACTPATTAVAHQQRRPCAAGERSSCCVARRLRGGGLDDLDSDSDPAASADAEGPIPDPTLFNALGGAHHEGITAGQASHQLHCPMTMNTIGTAAPGLFFDVEAVASDIVISGIEIATEEMKPVEFAVYSCNYGSWLDAEFARIQTPRAWTCVMQPRYLEVECNPID